MRKLLILFVVSVLFFMCAAVGYAVEPGADDAAYAQWVSEYESALSRFKSTGSLSSLDSAIVKIEELSQNVTYFDRYYGEWKTKFDETNKLFNNSTSSAIIVQKGTELNTLSKDYKCFNRYYGEWVAKRNEISIKMGVYMAGSKDLSDLMVELAEHNKVYGMKERYDKEQAEKEKVKEKEEEKKKEEEERKKENIGEYTILNDGKEKKADDIYKDSKLPSSFVGAEYYDVAMPYELSLFEVGGYITGPEGSAHLIGSEAEKGIKITANTSIEFGQDDGKSTAKTNFGLSDSEVGIDSETGCVTVTKNGVTFYVTAVQKFQFNTDTALNWWGATDTDSGEGGGFNGASNGYLIDVILTDGTVIHFLKGDSNSARHTNGMVGGNGGTSTDGDKTFEFGAVKLKQYANIAGVTRGNSLELWGENSKFERKYNLGSGAGKTRIAYYRLYKVHVSQEFKPASDAVKAVSYKLGNLKATDGTVTEGVLLSQTGLYAESRFVDVPGLGEDSLKFNTKEDLTKEQLEGVVDWRENIAHGKDDVIASALRRVVMLLGIAMLVWTVVIYMSYWFDRVNNFVDIDVLPIVTFGHLRVSADETDCTFGSKGGKGEAKTVNHKAIATVCAVGLFVSVFIVTGYFYVYLEKLVLLVLKFMGV